MGSPATLLRRRLCLGVAALCVLATLAGAAVRYSEVAHHRAHVLVVASASTDLHTTAHRSVDASPAAPRDAIRASITVAAAHSRPAPSNSAPLTLRSRGPPAAWDLS